VIKNHIHAETKSIRVFFAIFPNQSVQTQLAHQAELLEPACGGHKIKTQHLHLTLLFLGNVAMHHIDTLRQTMKNVSAQAFEFNLEEICYWKQNKILYMQAKPFPGELFSFVNLLRNTISLAGFLFDVRAFKPHVTIIRKAAHPVKAHLTHPIKWQVNQWFLVQSEQIAQGVNYIALDQWHLK
jgi:2'-5' RNA ligase